MTHRGLFTWIPSPEGMEQSEDEQDARCWNSEDEQEALDQAEDAYWAYWPDRLLAKRPPIGLK